MIHCLWIEFAPNVPLDPFWNTASSTRTEKLSEVPVLLVIETGLYVARPTPNKIAEDDINEWRD